MKLHRCRRDPKAVWLRSIPGFERFRPREIAELTATVDRVSVSRGRRLTAQGQRGLECFIVAAGQAEVRRDGSVIATVGAGDVVGELALLDQSPRNADVVATTDVELGVLDVRSFHQTLKSTPRFRQLVHDSAATRRP